MTRDATPAPTPKPTQAPDALDAALHRHFQAEPPPADDGFSLRVMAALPPAVTPRQIRRARRLRRLQWLAMTLAGAAAAYLLAHDPSGLNWPHRVAGLALVALVAYWAVPSRWNRG